jgi:hypothetical protein
MVLAGQFVAMQNSWAIISLNVWRTTFFNTRWSLLLIKHSLLGRGLIIVVPSHFHFTITSPTANLGNLIRVAMSLTGFLLK